MKTESDIEKLAAEELGSFFVLGYPPAVNNLYATVRGHRVLTARGRQYKLDAACRYPKSRPLSGPVEVIAHVYRPRRVGDLDNTLKVVLDALKNIAWADDSQVVHLEATRHDDKANPRVEVTVLTADSVPGVVARVGCAGEGGK